MLPMEFFEHIYTFLSLFNIFLAGTIIFLERRDISATWAWLIVLLFLPVLGFILYLMLGQNLRRRKIYKLKTKEINMIKELVADQKQQLEQLMQNYSDQSMASKYQNMICFNLTSGSSIFTQDNSVEIYTEGESKFASLFKSINEAKDHIHLLYYIFNNDKLGKRLVNLLVEKAKAGVQVRLLYDHIGSLGLERILQPLVDAGGQVAAFFPSKIPYLNLRLNYRNHRKLAIIDGQVGFVGGINVGDEYLGLVERFGYWRDTHLKITGSAVYDMQTRFILDWNLSSEHKLNLKHQLFPPVTNAGKIGVQMVSSGPHSEAEQIKNSFIKMIYGAKENIYIQTPYFVPDEPLLSALKTAALSGVDVRVMMPAKPDHKFVKWVAFSYMGEVLNAGVKVYQYEKGFLHAKTIVVDGKIASVGTTNFDVRSFKLNFETNAIIYDSDTATKLQQIFVSDMLNCRELTLDQYNNRSTAIKFKESITRLLSPIM